MPHCDSSEAQKHLQAWLAHHCGDGAVPPFSFICGGSPSSEFLQRCAFDSETRSQDTKTIHTFIYTDPGTRLQIQLTCEVFDAFPAVEWVIRFRNSGSLDTPIIEDIWALDSIFTVSAGEDVILHRFLGSSCAATDFAPIRKALHTGESDCFAPQGGRSSNTSAAPFFNIEMPDYGVMVGIGWSGQWAARLIRDASGRLRVRAGMEKTHLRLRPGEEIRSPRILLLFWRGEPIYGYNTWRRFIYTHHTPLIDGVPMLPLVSCNTWFPSGDDGNLANERNQLEIVDAYSSLGIEYLVIDAGWFDGLWPRGVGNWSVRKDAYPNGLKPVADAAHRNGIQFGLWFEPERVSPGTRLHREHPEWLLKALGSHDCLLNLGLPDAQRWTVDMVSEMINSVGIDYFRHDFNIDPLPFWHANDAPDRRGMTEIRYVEQLYALWDDLLRHHPKLVIEGCASGGRRIDLETISRCHIYWKSDLYFNSEANQAHAHAGNLFLPANYWNTPLIGVDDYAFHSCLGGALCLAWDPRQEGFPTEKARSLVEEYKRLRPLMLGDFYPLFDYSLAADQSIGFQFHRNDVGQGMVVLFRRVACPDEPVLVRFKGLKPDTAYEVSRKDTCEKRIVVGQALLEGIKVDSSPAWRSTLITYRTSQ